MALTATIADRIEQEVREVHMEKILKACWCFIILGLIWQGLELLLYGQIQHRVVDDIMGLLFFPFIYKSVN